MKWIRSERFEMSEIIHNTNDIGHLHVGVQSIYGSLLNAEPQRFYEVIRYYYEFYL